jgi:hypothetical protein
MRLLRSKSLWAAAGVVLALGLGLALLDGANRWPQGWIAYSALLALGCATLFGVWQITGRDIPAIKATLTAFLLRLVIGVALTLLLPTVGYADSPVHQQGYVFFDAMMRDQHAWSLVETNQRLLRAFDSNFFGGQDRYPGMLAFSAAIYRLFSPDAHRPFLILILTATAAAVGVLFMQQAAKNWFGSPAAHLAAWIFALYPEGVLLGSSQMREAFILLGVVLVFYSLAQEHKPRWSYLIWLGLGGLFLLFFHPPTALITFILIAGLWLLQTGRHILWRRVGIVSVFVALSFALVVSIWSNLPSLQGVGPFGLITTWFQNNFAFQSHLAEIDSGMMQALIRRLGEQWTWLIVLVYGLAQPVLPAVVGDPGAAWVMRLIGFFRAAGWYALAPVLVYGIMGALRASTKERRGQLLWLSLAFWVWAAISALNAGGDQWDNPRYRALFLPWAALLAAWAWEWARARRDPWLKRWLAVEAIFVLSFAEWYATRYVLTFAHLDIVVMVILNLAAAAVILMGGWWMDRRRQ